MIKTQKGFGELVRVHSVGEGQEGFVEVNILEIWH
jgi:hypothetical protein